ncbi:MAG: NAD/NADP octopine/nopaline dehydrogenase family protein, partial [Terriglobia bacterium]
AVLGAGHGGCAAAADLTARGYVVHLHARREASLEPLRKAGGINARGVQQGLFPIAKMTTDVAEAVAGADLIMLVVPSVAHSYYAKALAGLIDGTVPIFLNPGHTGGGMHFVNELRTAGYRVPVKTGETVSLTYITRMEGPATVGIYSYTRNQRFAALPGRHADEMFEIVHAIYPETVKASSVIETALANMNAVFHPPGMILNAGWIQRTNGNFLFYKEGVTDAIGRVSQAVDDERMAVAKAIEVPARSFLDNFYAAGLTTKEAHDSGSIARACAESEPNKTIRSPSSLDHRYVHEDVGYGLVPFAALGCLAGVSTPTIDALVHLASVATGIGYGERGLSLEKMGLQGMSIPQLKRYVETGDRS